MLSSSKQIIRITLYLDTDKADSLLSQLVQCQTKEIWETNLDIKLFWVLIVPDSTQVVVLFCFVNPAKCEICGKLDT